MYVEYGIQIDAWIACRMFKAKIYLYNIQEVIYLICDTSLVFNYAMRK